MSMTKESAIKAIQESKQFFYMSSPATNLPFVECDQETFNDQVWMFANEPEAKKYFDETQEKHFPVEGRLIENANYPGFFYQLHMMGVNALMWVDGEEKIELELDEVSPMPEVPEEQQMSVPPMNQELMLSGIYFLQEMRRNVAEKIHFENNAHILEEEFLVNICKTGFFMPMRENEEGQPQGLYVKDKNEKVYMPFFSDTLEMTKHVGYGIRVRVGYIPFAKLKDMVPKDMEGVIINPESLNLPLSMQQLEELSNGDED